MTMLRCSCHAASADSATKRMNDGDDDDQDKWAEGESGVNKSTRASVLAWNCEKRASSKALAQRPASSSGRHLGIHGSRRRVVG